MLGLVSDGMGVNPFTEQVIYGTDLVGMNAPNAKKAADNMVERLRTYPTRLLKIAGLYEDAAN